MTTVDAPTLLGAVESVAHVVREQADESERLGRHTDTVISAMKAARLFKGLTPRALGGSEADPRTWYETVEAAARIDGSFGWTMFINGSTGLASQSRSEAEAERAARDPDYIVAGSVFPYGKALSTNGGYIGSGRWTYCSGIPHASDVFGFAAVFDGDTPRMLAPGMPMVVMLFAKQSQVEVLPTWNVSGLSATGSNDFVMHDVFIPEEDALRLVGQPSNRYYQAATYRMPFIALFALPIAAVALGIAQHAIDAILELAAKKVPAGTTAVPLRERTIFHLQLAEAQAAVGSARAWLHQAIDAQYELVEAGGNPDLAMRMTAQLAASNAVRSAAHATEVMYLAGGGTSNFRSSALQRCMRDMHAVTQHVATGPATWEACGMIGAGLPPPNPLILL